MYPHPSNPNPPTVSGTNNIVVANTIKEVTGPEAAISTTADHSTIAQPNSC